MTLAKKKIMITGGSRGLGRAMAEAAAHKGAEVWVIGRDRGALEDVANSVDGIHALELDVTEGDAALRAFEVVVPDVLILSAGATPTMAPVREQSWEQFSANWNTDVKASMLFGVAALTYPMPEGGMIVTISSGAGINGSFASGGYAGAKRMQWFLSNYLQKEAEELGRALRFLTILPLQQFADTALGQEASGGYARRLGIEQSAFLAGFKNALTPAQFAEEVFKVISGSQYAEGAAFAINGEGVKQLDQSR